MSDTNELIKAAIEGNDEALIELVCRATAGDDATLDYLYRRSQAGFAIPNVSAKAPTDIAPPVETGSPEITVKYDEVAVRRESLACLMMRYSPRLAP